MNNYNDKPLVSIGIPCYNRPVGLHRTLECITNQTYKNLEIIISDNCSPNHEVEKVAKEFVINDNRIKYYRQSENKGSPYNFKYVLEKSSGKYFMWAADDDYFDTFNLVKELVLKIEEDNCVLAFSDVNIVYDNGRIANKNFMAKIFNTCVSDRDYLMAWCSFGGGYPFYGLYNLQLIMHRKSLRFKFDEYLRCFNEGTFLHRIFIHGGARFVGTVSYNFVRSSNNKSSTVKPHILLIDFIKYTKKVIPLYLFCDLPLTSKIEALKNIMKTHCIYIYSLSINSISSLMKYLLIMIMVNIKKLNCL